MLRRRTAALALAIGVAASLAVLALLALLWARWGLVVVLMSDFIKYCF